MRKLLIGFLIAVFSIGINYMGVENVFAKDEGKKFYKDGEYTVGYTVDVEQMEGFIENKPEVEIKDGKAIVKVTFNSASMIKDLSVEGKETKRKDIDEKLAKYSFEVEDLDEVFAMKVHVVAEEFGYDEEYSFNLTLDTSEIPYKDQDSDKNMKKVYDDGKYTVDYSVDVEHMERFIEKNPEVEIRDGKILVTITFNSASMIKDLSVEGKETKRKDIDEDLVEYSFEVEDLDEVFAMEVHVVAGEHDQVYPFNLTLDTSNIPYEMVEIEETEEGNPGKPGEQGEPGTPGEQGEPGKPGDKGEPGADGKDGKDGKDGQDGQDGRDGQYGTLGSGNNGGNGTTGGTQGTDGSTSAGVSPEANPKTSDNAPIL